MGDKKQLAAEADIELALAEAALETAQASLKSARRLSWLDLSGLLDSFFWQDDKIDAKDTAAYWLGIAQDHLREAAARVAPGHAVDASLPSGSLSGLWNDLDTIPGLTPPIVEFIADLRAHQRIGEIGDDLERTAAAVAALRAALK